MKYLTKQDIIISSIVSVVFILIILLLVNVLPLKTDEANTIRDFNINKYDTNYQELINQYNTDANKAIALCQKMCKDINNVISYESGPCLSDLFGFKVEDWVCDIVNNPRTDVDNKSKNKCKAYDSGSANHFVELDKNCNLVRIY